MDDITNNRDFIHELLQAELAILDLTGRESIPNRKWMEDGIDDAIHHLTRAKNILMEGR